MIFIHLTESRESVLHFMLYQKKNLKILNAGIQKVYFFSGAIVKVNMSRLLLCEATANVIATGFHVLGINPLEKMWLSWPGLASWYGEIWSFGNQQYTIRWDMTMKAWLYTIYSHLNIMWWFVNHFYAK